MSREPCGSRFRSLLVNLRAVQTLVGSKDLSADFNLFGFCNIEYEQSEPIAFANSRGKRLYRKAGLAYVFAQAQPRREVGTGVRVVTFVCHLKVVSPQRGEGVLTVDKIQPGGIGQWVSQSQWL